MTAELSKPLLESPWDKARREELEETAETASDASLVANGFIGVVAFTHAYATCGYMSFAFLGDDILGNRMMQLQLLSLGVVFCHSSWYLKHPIVQVQTNPVLA